MNLKANPFFLSDEEIEWVESTWQSMGIEEKIGQLFCPIGYSTDPDYLRHELLDKHIGGLFFRDGEGKEMQATFGFAQAYSRIPLLIPSNLEAGGDGAATDGTPYGKQMEVAAANDPVYAYRLGRIATGEARALGINWAFAPVVDIDMNFRNPITNVRTYGNDREKVLANAREYIRAAKENGVAVSVKHFPGDGVDERDQHILTSVNSLSMEEWDESFGYIYKNLIEDGALTVMAGHIAMPAYQEHFNSEMKDKLVPATLSPELLGKLLREKLGFNGLIITDATPMVGYTAAEQRSKAIPKAIESGCDMILFNKDLAEDYEFMMAGYRNGMLSSKRLEEAVYRILALKAALKLPVKKKENSLVPGEEALSILKCKEHVAWAYELADKAITLVKDTQAVLPISPDKYRRVLLEVLGGCASDERVLHCVRMELQKRGFEVTLYEKEDFAKGVDNVAMFKSKYDLVIYLGNVENASNKTTNRINWYTFFGQGNNLPWFVKKVPVIFASVANPYHLFDVPMIQTYINCYSNNQYVLEELVIDNLKTNHFVNPLGYQLNRLHFSWEVTETTAKTDCYTRIRIFSGSESGETVYDSGKMMNYGQPFFCPDFAPEYESRYYWQVEVEADNGEWQVSGPAWFETALPTGKWPALWISPAKEGEAMPCLYREFGIKAPVKRGRLYCCGLGLYEGYLNHNRIGDEFLMPGYHSYDLVKQYQTWDVTEMLTEGSNRLAFILGEGWYKGRFVFEGGYENLYGSRKMLTAALSVEYQDGSREYLCTDGTWKAEETEILSNNIYDGEVIDCGRKKEKLSVEVLGRQEAWQALKPIPRFNMPLRKVEAYQVKELLHTPLGKIVLDFGEAITGWVEVLGAGAMDFCLKYGELMQNGELYRENLRTAKAEFRFRGEAGGEWLRPHFTYYGFRYVQVEGIENPKPGDFIAYRLMSDLEQTGNIETSDEKLNKLIDNTRRSQKCNFIDIPIDCSQRDERMGWTGDIAIFAGSGSFHMDTAAFLNHYMMNLKLEQRLLEGAVPFFVPRPKPEPHGGINPFLVTAGACTWGDAATIVPWQLYLHYGDKAMLSEHYPIMCAWVQYIEKRASQSENPFLWQNDRHLGDWLALDNGDTNNPIGSTDAGFIASAYYYYSTVLCRRAAKALARAEDEMKWAAKAEQIKAAFIKEYLDKNGDIKVCRTQTAYAVLLYMGLYEQDKKTVAVQGMKKVLQEYGCHLSTGFVGTSILMQALSENGMKDEAYTLLMQEDYPGWLREVNMGATTVWERWNSIEDNGIISDTGMNSLNHYAYGCVAGWMYESMCGFRREDDGTFYLEPQPDKRIQWVKGKCKLPQGMCHVEWMRQEDGSYKISVEIPFQAKVKARLPEGMVKVLESGRYTF